MTTNTVGVGPYSEKWPDDPRYDKELLAHGDRRNVEDKYRYLTVDAIKAELEATRHPFHIAIENWQHDINIGTIVRNANAFNASGVHIIGKHHWNRRGAMVTDRYMNVFHYSTVDEFKVAMGDRAIIAVDNLPGAEPLAHTALPEDCVLVFGGEGPGLSEAMRGVADMMIMIEQFGSTRSVNVGVASGIVMYRWLEQHIL